MTSPVDTSVKHFTSAMIGAPVLNGVAGSLISLLDACLINGFGLRSLTSLVVSGGIATASFSGGATAALPGSVIVIAGATPAGLNGEQKVLTASSTAVTFATAEANGAATGTLTLKMAPAAYWTKPFSGTNLAVYRSTHPEGTGMYLRVDDTLATYARVIGYETMSDVNTGTGPFPTTAQVSGGGYWAKSHAANTTANIWVVAADSRMFFFWCAPYYANGITQRAGPMRAFGDILSFRPTGDPYGCVLNYSTTASVASMYDGAIDGTNDLRNAMPRSYTGLGTSVQYVSVPYTGSASGISGVDNTLSTFPNVIDGSLRLVRRYLATSASSQPPRGDVPGVHYCPQSTVFDSFSWGDTLIGTGTLTGKTLLVTTPTNTTMGGTAQNSSAGASFMDITGPWR